MMQLSAPQMSVLYSDLQFEDSLGVIKKLEGMNIPHEVRQNGAVILAPKDRILRLRMDLAEEGLPSGGKVGYEIFDKTGSLGTTSFVQNINHIRALEGELARTIRTLRRVSQARVHLVLPKKKIFSREKVSPTASIILKTRGNLDGAQIAAIQHLVASAIEGLKPARVSIVDDRGHLLASGDGDAKGFTGAKSDERTLGLEKRMRTKIEEIVTSIVGENRARIRVTAELDFNRITQTSDSFDPDTRVVRSTQNREESSTSSRTTTNQGVSVGTELPGANAANGGKDGDKDASRKTEEIVNYEISRTTKTETFEGGRIKRLSVAVLIDGTYSAGADGKPVYKERTQQELDKISVLVKSAMGFDKIRGDQLHVVNLRFADTGTIPEISEAEGGFFDLSKSDYFHIAELAILFIISSLVLLFVVRPLVRRIITPETTEDEQVLLTTDENGNRILVNANGQPLLEENETLALENQKSETSDVIKNAIVSGEIQASAVQEIGAIVESSPTDAVAVLRQWMDSDELAKEEEAA
jgi:flagellar M-ring protein FliF